MKDGIFKEALIKNQISAWNYFHRFCNMALSCFKWNNLPKTCDARYLELSLLKTGNAVFFKDDILGFLTLMCEYSAPLDAYGFPTKCYAYAENNYRKELTNENSVVIFNNKLHTNNITDLMDFSSRLYEIDRTIDVNVKAQKTPVLIIGDEKQKLALKNLYQKYDGNEPVIYGDKQLTADTIQCLRTDAPFISSQLYELKINIWNEALTYLGITNVSEQKKERMVTDEVNRSLGGVLLNREIRLSERQLACEKINDMFGLNVSVEFVGDKEVVTNESLYNGD